MYKVNFTDICQAQHC